MLDLTQYSCLGAALRDALDRWPNETCLIESDRDKEKLRLTYSDFKEMARRLARALQDSDLKAGSRTAIIMTNQSKWLVSSCPLALQIAHNPDRGILPVACDHAIAGVQESPA